MQGAREIKINISERRGKCLLIPVHLNYVAPVMDMNILHLLDSVETKNIFVLSIKWKVLLFICS